MRNFLLVSALLAAPSLSYAACTITDEKTERELSKVQGIISSGDFGSAAMFERCVAQPIFYNGTGKTMLASKQLPQ